MDLEVYDINEGILTGLNPNFAEKIFSNVRTIDSFALCVSPSDTNFCTRERMCRVPPKVSTRISINKKKNCET